MVKKTVRESLYFVLMASILYLFLRIGSGWGWFRNFSLYNPNVAEIIFAVVYTLIMLGIYLLSNINNNHEGFWDVSAGAQCKGGNWYNWQGDDPTSKMCRELAKTKEGRYQIASHSCPKGYEGTPKIPFEYTPLSNDRWQNERC